MRVLSFIVLFVLSLSLAFSQEKEVVIPYTQADRDRMVRVETRLDNVDERLNRMDITLKDIRTEVQNGQAELRSLIHGLIYFIFGLIGVLIALVIWDRRTLIRPVTAELTEEKAKLKEEVRFRKQLMKVLKDASEKDSNIRDAMKHTGLL